MHSEDSPLPLRRSLLFVPANNERVIDRAHTRGADVLVRVDAPVVARAERH